MPDDDQKTELEKQIGAEEAAIEAELSRLKSNENQPLEPPESAKTGLELEQTTRVPEEPPPVQETPPPPPEETKPPEPPKEDRPPERTKADYDREGRLRRELREREKELAELRRANQERQQQNQPKDDEQPKKDPTYEEDPAEYLKRRADYLDQQLQQERNIRAWNERMDRIRQSEREFEQQHPDYRESLEYLEKHEVNEWERTGVARADVTTINNALNAGRQGNPNFKPLVDHIDRLASDPGVIEYAEKTNRDVEDAAIYLAARDTYLNNRRELVRRGAETTGSNPAEIAYNLSMGRGYIAKQQQQRQTSEDAARRQVERQKEISQATQSLSESSTSQSGTGPKVIRNRNDVLNLNDDELDSIIKDGSYRGL